MSTIEQPAPALRLGFSFGPSQPPRSLGCSLPSGRARLDAIFISEKAFHHAQQIQTVRQIDVAHEAEHRRESARDHGILGAPCDHAVGAKTGSPRCLTRLHQGHGSRSEASTFCGLSWVMVQFRSGPRHHRVSVLRAWSTRFPPMP
jgi:hypothetical protein